MWICSIWENPSSYTIGIYSLCYTSNKKFFEKPTHFWGWKWGYRQGKHKIVFISSWKCTNQDILSTERVTPQKRYHTPGTWRANTYYPPTGRKPNSSALIPRGLCQIGRVLNEQEPNLSFPKEILPRNSAPSRAYLVPTLQVHGLAETVLF